MLRFLLRTGFRRGLLGGSRGWTAVGAVALGLRVLKKITGSEPEIVHATTLRPGESLVVRHDDPSRSARRRRR
ncbi:MAG: hypothetical protein ABIS21_01535 [Acidimicrobiales bacterium]